jgi:sigma-E factor negative regulatory protein RseA
MHTPSGIDPLDPESLSALCDGEADDADAARWLQTWAEDDATTHERWHRYHLIGDVLRSADLGRQIEHDSAFLATLRQRLHESAGADTSPVVTPAAKPASAPLINLDAARLRARQTTRRWAMPAGIAAGVALVAGLFTLVHRPAADESWAATDGADREVRMVDRNSRRDPRLDSYLAAHRQFQPATALGPSSGFLRSAAYEIGPDR